MGQAKIRVRDGARAHAGRLARLAPLDGGAHAVAPLGPGAVVIAHVLIAEQVGEHKPGVAGALADAAVGDDVVGRLQAALLGVDLPQLLAPT